MSLEGGDRLYSRRIPDDEAIIISTNKGTPATLENNSLASQAFKNVAERITGKTVPFVEMKKQTKILGRISKLWNRG